MSAQTDQLSDVAINFDIKIIKKLPSCKLIIRIVLAWMPNDITHGNN